MSTAENLLGTVAAELAALFEPLNEATSDATGTYELLSRMGWDLDALIGADLAALADEAQALARGFEQLASREIKTLDDAVALIKALLEQVDRIETLRQTITRVAQVELAPEVARALAEDLFTYLFIRYLERRSFALLQLAILLTLIEPEEGTALRAGGATGPVVRLPKKRAALRFDHIPRLLTDPVGHLRSVYLPSGEIETQAAAERLVATLFRRIRNVVLALGGRALVGLDGSPVTELRDLPALLRSITATFGGLPIFDATTGAVRTQVVSGITATIVPADAEGAPGVPGPGLALSPFGVVSVTAPLGTWDLAIRIGGQPGPVFLSRAGVTLSGQGAGVDATAAIRRSAETAAPIVIGSADGTRLQIGQPGLVLHACLTPGENDFGFLVEVDRAALVIAAGDGDGFLQQVLPEDGLRVTFDLAVGWSRARGLSFRGSAGLDATFAIHQDVAGILRIDQAHLQVHVEGAAVQARAAVSFSVQLGPVKAAVERVGLGAHVDFSAPDHVAPLDLALKFQPPRGAAVAIDAGVVIGGGYLAFDAEQQQYSGAVMLEIAKVLNVTAFGLLTTRMPDGTPGFSLLVLISVEFTPPLQLGFGFTLNGIGGLVGVNRTVAVDTLRAGLKAGSLGRILFPADPIRNAPQIVSDLQAIFPPAPGRFLFGPMVRLGWGTPTLLTLDLGLILELPAPVRLVILGRMRMMLPEARAAIVRLQLDVLGVIDFESGDIAIDAVLYDSRVAVFAITGDMALRANFGARPVFVLAVGGFHPRFTPPDGFPQLARVAISLATGNNPRLRLEAYLALTTNTVQFGARLDLYVGFAGFSVEGYLGFDTLIQFAPFGLIVDIRAGVAIKFAGISLLAIALELTLSGPSPWRARGKAKFTIIFFSVSVSFDLRFGKAERPPLPSPTDVLSKLLEAIAEDGNWGAPLTAGAHPIVSLRQDRDRPRLFVHPLAEVQIRQRITPLEREIARFGNTGVEGVRRFTVRVVGPDGVPLSHADANVQLVTEMFAPSHFYEMTDEEKLAAPAFEAMAAGIQFGKAPAVAARTVAETETRYETGRRYGAFDPEAHEARQMRGAAAPASRVSRERTAGRALPRAAFERATSTGAAAMSPRNTTGPAKFAGPAFGVSLRPRAGTETWRMRSLQSCEPEP